MKVIKQRAFLAGAAAACLVLLFAFLGKTRFSASVVDLLAGKTVETQILGELAEGSAGKLMMVRLYSENGEAIADAESTFRKSLLETGSVTKAWSSGQEGLEQAGKLLFDDRYFWMLPNWMDEHFEIATSAAPPDAEQLADKVVQNLVAYLDSPDGMALIDLIPSDPFLLMQQLENLFPGISNPAGKNKETIIWIEQVASPFSESGQQELFLALETALSQARQKQTDLQMEYSGVAVFAHASKKGIKGEIERLNLLGIVLVLLITLYTVRRAALLLKIGLVVLMALLVAATAVVTVFESVHVIALVIGSILTGIAVDYGFHILLRENNCLTDKDTRKAVIAGSLSSALGFMVLMGAPLPFLRQVGVFVGSGLLAAMATALVLGSGKSEGISHRAVKLRPGVLPLWIGLLLLLVALPGLLMLSWSSDIKDLEYPLPELKETDERLRSLASPVDRLSPHLLFAEDIFKCRELLDELDPEDTLTHAGNILPRLGEILETRELFRQTQGFREALLMKLDQEGFYAEAFEEFLKDWDAYLEMPLSGEVYEGKLSAFADALPGPLQNFVHSGESISWMMVLSPTPLAEDFHPNLIQLEQSDMLTREFAAYGRTMWMFAGICLLTLGISVCVYFGLHPGLASLAVPIMSCGIAFGIIGLWHGDFGLFHLVGGILAFCISLDYGLFATTARKTGKPLPKSITVSSMTTIAVFGVLATSHLPGVHDMAVTVLLVMVFTLVVIHLRWPERKVNAAPLFERIPHGTEALMVESVSSLEAGKIVAICNPHQFQPIATESLVEAMAQCAALLLAGGESGKTSRPGMLVVVQSFEIQSPTLRPGLSVIASVCLLSEAKEGLVQFSGECCDQEDKLLASSKFSIFIPPVDSQG